MKYCLKCFKKIKAETNLLTFFKTYNEKFCKKCYDSMIYIRKETLIPINNKMIYCNYLIGDNQELNNLVYINIFCDIFKNFNQYKRNIILYIYNFDFKTYSYLEKLDIDIYLIVKEKEDYI